MTAPFQDRQPDAAETARLEVEFVAAERLVFFSDAVVAIAITLLALALPVPHGDSNSQVLRSLWDHHAEYLAFMISFVVIGGHWAAHHRLFPYVMGLGGHVEVLNMLWLLMMVITPFATRMLAGDGGFAVRFAFYAVVQAIAVLVLVEINRQLVRYRLLRPGTPESVITGSQVPALTMAGTFLLSIPVAFFTQWAYACWVAIPLVTRGVRKLIRRRRAASADAG